MILGTHGASLLSARHGSYHIIPGESMGYYLRSRVTTIPPTFDSKDGGNDSSLKSMFLRATFLFAGLACNRNITYFLVDLVAKDIHCCKLILNNSTRVHISSYRTGKTGGSLINKVAASTTISSVHATSTSSLVNTKATISPAQAPKQSIILSSTYLHTGTVSQAAPELHQSPRDLITHGHLTLVVASAARGTPATPGSAVGEGTVAGGDCRAMASSGSLGLDCLGSGVAAL